MTTLAAYLVGDCRAVLRAIPERSAQACVTSPPYFGLRDYGTARWEGGNDPACAHGVSHAWDGPKQGAHAAKADRLNRRGCASCGAVRVDRQIGAEQTLAEYVESLVSVFRGVRRALRDDGLLFLNLGDSYAANRPGQAPGTRSGGEHGAGQAAGGAGTTVPRGLKPKDLIGVPWRVAFALQEDGWYLRSAIVWRKGNAMPESVRDRPTSSYEMVFMLSKSETYYYDHLAVQEDAVSDHGSGNGFKRGPRKSFMDPDGSPRGNDSPWVGVGGKRNARNVLDINSKPYRGAHFAVMPEALANWCVRAATSGHGACAACGAPFARVTERTCAEDETAKGSRFDRGKTGGRPGGDRTQPGPRFLLRPNGWKPTCRCPQGGRNPRPCLVLDPFGGAGTTALAAQRIGRDACLIDLNPGYEALAQERLGKPLLDFFCW